MVTVALLLGRLTRFRALRKARLYALEHLARSKGRRRLCNMEDMRAYSTDLKERLVRAVAEGQPMREAARRFGVAVTTVKRAVVPQRETGSLERKPIPGYPRRIGPDLEVVLRARLAAAPDATVLEHCAWWAEQYGQRLSEATMWRAIHRLGWTHKKR